MQVQNYITSEEIEGRKREIDEYQLYLLVQLFADLRGTHSLVSTSQEASSIGHIPKQE